MVRRLASLATVRRLCAGAMAFCIVMAACNLGRAQSLPADKADPRANGAETSDDKLPGPSSDMSISPDDVLQVLVMDVPELSRQYRVSGAGTVLLPLLDHPVQAAGLKLTEFSKALAKELRDSGLVSRPNVVVSIAQSRVKSVAITGAVRKPQIYSVFGRTTLLDVLSQAEGLDKDASNTAIITRGTIAAEQIKSGERSVTVDLKKLLESGDPTYNLDIYPGDRVTVPRAGIVYVVGAVNRPGGFTINSSGDGMTVLQALAMAEDVKSTALRDKAAIIRSDPTSTNGHKQVPLNLKLVLAGKADDPVLQANDILFVPDSQGAKAFRKGIEAVLQTATGIAIYRR